MVAVAAMVPTTAMLTSNLNTSQMVDDRRTVQDGADALAMIAESEAGKERRDDECEGFALAAGSKGDLPRPHDLRDQSRNRARLPQELALALDGLGVVAR